MSILLARGAAAAAPAPAADPRRQGLAGPTLAAIGVVYGDIGTSPLYTVKEIFAPTTGVALNAANLVGAVSCIFWALMIVVTLKYVILILRADNRGEGGVLALTALATHAVAERPALRNALLLFGGCGATLFYGDSVITPAISVLGAMEGLEIATPALKAYVVPVSLAILFGLFVVQRFGTADGGQDVRADHLAVVLDAGRHRRDPHRRAAGDPGRARSAAGLAFPQRTRLACLRRRGRDRAGAHRCRSAVCRHGPLRPQADPVRLDRASCCRRWR